MRTIRHMNIHVEGMARIIRSSSPMLPAQKEILPYLVEAKERGLTYLPACDNCNPDGSCAGHEEEGAQP